jgi:hypothetical protein
MNNLRHVHIVSYHLYLMQLLLDNLLILFYLFLISNNVY